MARGHGSRGRAAAGPGEGSAKQGGGSQAPPSAAGTSVLLVDGHGLFREALCAVLEGAHGLRVVAEAGRLSEALAAVARARPEVVVTDFRLPEAEDGAVVAELSRLRPGVPVVVLTAVPPAQCLHAALQTGAQGFVMKDAAAYLLAKAIAAVRAGEIWVQREAFAQQVQHLRGQAARMAAGSASLSSRELQVLRLLAGGASSGEIARDLSITPSTVRVHLLHVLEKLGATSRVAAVRQAIRLRLVDP